MQADYTNTHKCIEISFSKHIQMQMVKQGAYFIFYIYDKVDMMKFYIHDVLHFSS